MTIKAKRFRVEGGSPVDLRQWPTRIEPLYEDEGHYRNLLREHVEQLSERQELLTASERCAVLVIFQAMDAGGKDSVISHVMTGVNPQGCRVTGFKPPSEEELKHDFLWRTIRDLPERGCIGIYNRSYYEEVLVTRVHPEKLRAQGVTGSRIDGNKIWRERYRSIVNLERHLDANATRIVKFFLHVSQDEQRKRLIERIDTPEKNWKIRAEDIEERAFWKDYMRAYQKCLAATGTKRAPWFVIPADDKPNAHLIVSKIMLDVFLSLDLKLPKVARSRRRELLALRTQLTN